MDDRARAAAEPLAEATLADRFDLGKSRVLLTGAQAIARLLLSQKARDRSAGLNTGGFVSGYRGSPLGGLDLQFLKIAELFAANDIHFEPGLNETRVSTASIIAAAAAASEQSAAKPTAPGSPASARSILSCAREQIATRAPSA